MPLTVVDQGLLSSTAQYTGFKNRLINGQMVIDQRNAGASVTRNGTNNVYTLDRWNTRAEASDGVYTVQQVVDGPSGFINSLKVTVTTADASIGAGQVYAVNQAIEGYNIADLNWGATAASAGKTAQTVTLSFWVKSSLTGSFGASLFNNNSSPNRSYPFLYTISTANTWEQKSVTIAGDTSATWATDNTSGIWVNFAIGTGSSELGTVNAWSSALYRGASGQTQIISTLNATWQVTGVQLEKGSTATSFDYRPYTTELQLCQRYYWKNKAGGVYTYLASAVMQTSSSGTMFGKLPVSMRANPSVAINTVAIFGGVSIVAVTGLSSNYSSVDQMAIDITGTSFTPTTGAVALIANNSTSAFIELSAEL